MIDHLGINCEDYAKAQEFYDRVLGVLGYLRQLDFGEAVGYGPEAARTFGSPRARVWGLTARRISRSLRPTMMQ